MKFVSEACADNWGKEYAHCHYRPKGAFRYIAAVQLASHDINVNAICPGLVDTQMLRSMLAQRSADTGTPVEQLVEGLEQMVPLGRLDDPEDIAAMAAFLAGPGGRNITGQAINNDGGLVMN